MSRINRIPKGLQSLFGNTAAGKNPSELASQVLPAIDLTWAWAVDQTRFVRFNGQFAAAFQKQTLQVPSGKMWIPLSMAGEAVMNVGETIAFALGIDDESATRELALNFSPIRVATTAVEVVTAGFTWAQLHPMKAQQFFYSRCQIFSAAAARNMNLTVKVIELDV